MEQKSRRQEKKEAFARYVKHKEVTNKVRALIRSEAEKIGETSPFSVAFCIMPVILSDFFVEYAEDKKEESRERLQHSAEAFIEVASESFLKYVAMVLDGIEEDKAEREKRNS